MNKLRRVALLVLFLELAIFMFSYVSLMYQGGRKDRGMVRVEIKRAKEQIRQGKTTDEDLRAIAEEYALIRDIRVYDPGYVDNREYRVEEVGGSLYQFDYETKSTGEAGSLLLFSFFALFLMTLGAFFYVDKRILRPAENMTELTRELAKGNLSRPLLQEKSGYLKSFLWSVDMLRETLEDNRRREMALEKEKRSLVLSLAHDIKTPLSALDLYTKALSDNLYEDEEKKNAALLGIAKNKEEIRSYVDRITAASREDFLNLEVRAQEAYISSVMDPVRKYYRDKLQLLSIPFTILPYEDALIRCDRDRLVEVLQNCMENAVKYGDGREITVSIRQEEECKLFTVKNTGCTLREDELDAVFDSFYRGSNAGNQPGSGLGLYICRQLLHKMDGEIYAEIEDGCFLVTLVLRKV